MATILVCDACGVHEGVHQPESGGEFDLCGRCAIEALDRLVRDDAIHKTVMGVVSAMAADNGSYHVKSQENKAATEPSVAELSDEEKKRIIARRRSALFAQHATEIYGVTPDIPVEVGQVIKYGGRGDNVHS